MLKLVQINQLNTFPCEWDGLLADGRRMYARFRSGIIAASIGQTFDAACSVGILPRDRACTEYFKAVDAGTQEKLKGQALEDYLRPRIAQNMLAYPGGEIVIPRTQLEDEVWGGIDTERMLVELARHGMSIEIVRAWQEPFASLSWEQYMLDIQSSTRGDDLSSEGKANQRWLCEQLQTWQQSQ